MRLVEVDAFRPLASNAGAIVSPGIYRLRRCSGYSWQVKTSPGCFPTRGFLWRIVKRHHMISECRYVGRIREALAGVAAFFAAAIGWAREVRVPHVMAKLPPMTSIAYRDIKTACMQCE